MTGVMLGAFLGTVILLAAIADVMLIGIGSNTMRVAAALESLVELERARQRLEVDDIIKGRQP